MVVDRASLGGGTNDNAVEMVDPRTCIVAQDRHVHVAAAVWTCTTLEWDRVPLPASSFKIV